MDRQTLKMRIFVEFACNLARLSTCKRRKVGCIILPQDLTSIYAIGYNGPASGMPHSVCTGESGNCGCVHAETNAIAKLATCDRDCICITTCYPCILCSNLIVNTKRISSVIYIEERSLTSILRDCNVHVSQWHDPD